MIVRQIKYCKSDDNLPPMMIERTGVTKRNDQNQFGISFNGNLDVCAYTGLPESIQSNKSCSNYVKYDTK